MDKNEALKRALEAFEWNYNTDLDNIPACEKWAKMLKENIAAIKKVLAQPEQEPVAWMDEYGDVLSASVVDGSGLRNIPLYTAPPHPKPEQEPVVFFRTDNGWRKEEFEKTLVKNVPLDTTPPEPHVWFDFSNVPLDATSPQRKWVGLTVKEIEWCFYDANDARIVAARSIEAKLKQKNGFAEEKNGG